LKEIWRVIPDFPLYSASNLGRIKNKKTGTILKPYKNKKGYFDISIPKDVNLKSIRATKRIHKLISMTFLGKCTDGKEVNHKNCIKTDNSLKNLEYVTSRENSIHSIKMGVWKRLFNETDIREVKRLLFIEKFLSKKIAKIFKCHYSTILRIKEGKIYNWVD